MTCAVIEVKDISCEGEAHRFTHPILDVNALALVDTDKVKDEPFRTRNDFKVAITVSN